MKNDKEERKKEFKDRLYKFILRLISFIDSLPKVASNLVIGNQLLRSGTSVTGNYIEAQAASSKKDFTNYFQTALKSCVESQLWLELLRDTNPTKTQEATPLIAELKEITNIFGASLLRLKGKK